MSCPLERIVNPSRPLLLAGQQHCRNLQVRLKKKQGLEGKNYATGEWEVWR